MSDRPTARKKVFISYSHRDTRWINRLRVHLRPLERDHQVEVWDDTRIRPGEDWRAEIARAIESSQVAILLVSADFLASDFIVENELPPLLEAAQAGGATILNVIVGHCRFDRTPELCKFQAVNDPARPLAKIPVAEREAVWVRVTDSVDASFQGRPAAEGWLVRNEAAVLDALSNLIRKGHDGGFLIISSGDYYMQFMRQSGGKTLYGEAVSDSYLPEREQLSKKSADQLTRLGFHEPKDDTSNYSKTFRLGRSGAQLDKIASLVVTVFAHVYMVSERSKLDCQLILKV